MEVFVILEIDHNPVGQASCRLNKRVAIQAKRQFHFAYAMLNLDHTICPVCFILWSPADHSTKQKLISANSWSVGETGAPWTSGHREHLSF